MSNLHALYHLVQKSWPNLKIQGQGHAINIFGINRKLLLQGIHIFNMNAPSHLVQKLWPRLSFLKLGQKFKVTGSKLLVSTENYCHEEYTRYIIVLSPLVQKLWSRLSCSKVMVKITLFKSYGQD